MPNKWVYLFNEVDQAEAVVGGRWEDVRALLGGKGANLAEMTRIEVPVPPGFTITTRACNAYLASGGIFPEGMWDQVLKAVAGLEKEMRETARRPATSPAGVVPVRRQIFHAGNDGYHPEHRPQ
jgi:pyruvate,orthophosphate dikinase